MTRKRFQKLLMSEGVPAKQAKAYKIPTKHNGILYYCYSTDKGKTWALFNGASYQNWWNNRVISNNKLFNIKPIGGYGGIRTTAYSTNEYSKKSYRNLEI